MADLIIKEKYLETDTCPICKEKLMDWKGEMGELKECPSCGDRYSIESVYFLSKA